MRIAAIPGAARGWVRVAAPILLSVAIAGCSIPGRSSPSGVTQMTDAAGSVVPSASDAPSAGPTLSHGVFKATGSMLVQRDHPGVALLTDGRVLVVGGTIDQLALPSAQLYDPASGRWRATGSMQTGIPRPTSVVLADGRVLVAGGGVAELYDPVTGSFTPAGSTIAWRFGGTATLLADGRVLLAGGGGQSEVAPFLASAEIFDPVTGKFSKTGSMKAGREQAQAVRLSDGRILIVGGDQGAYADAHILSSAEIYDPSTGKFTETGQMRDARTDFTATLLPDGRVLVAGGQGPNPDAKAVATAELYDPVTGTFTPTGSMATGRIGHCAVPLLTGMILVAGGASSNRGPAELFDPATGSFRPTGTGLADQRQRVSGVRLPFGHVLVFGIESAGDATSELYLP
jgi:hypothetical protein